MSPAPWDLDSYELKAADRVANGHPVAYDDWLVWGHVYDPETDSIKVVSIGPRPNIQHEPAAYRRLTWDVDAGREPTPYEQRLTDGQR
jgi:hypothetical protein